MDIKGSAYRRTFSLRKLNLQAFWRCESRRPTACLASLRCRASTASVGRWTAAGRTCSIASRRPEGRTRIRGRARTGRRSLRGDVEIGAGARSSTVRSDRRARCGAADGRAMLCLSEIQNRGCRRASRLVGPMGDLCATGECRTHRFSATNSVPDLRAGEMAQRKGEAPRLSD